MHPQLEHRLKVIDLYIQAFRRDKAEGPQEFWWNDPVIDTVMPYSIWRPGCYSEHEGSFARATILQFVRESGMKVVLVPDGFILELP